MACGRLYGPISEYSSVKLNNYQRSGKSSSLWKGRMDTRPAKKDVVGKVNFFCQIIKKNTAKNDKWQKKSLPVHPTFSWMIVFWYSSKLLNRPSTPGFLTHFYSIVSRDLIKLYIIYYMIIWTMVLVIMVSCPEIWLNYISYIIWLYGTWYW